MDFASAIPASMALIAATLHAQVLYASTTMTTPSTALIAALIK
jgi:hypothetical protein